MRFFSVWCQRSILPCVFCDFTGIRLSDDITGHALLASYYELFAPFVIHALINAFSAAQFGDAVFAAQNIQHDPDFLLCAVLLTSLTRNVFNDRF